MSMDFINQEFGGDHALYRANLRSTHFGIGIGAGIAAAAIIGAGATVGSGIMASDAQKAAAGRASKSQADANRLNYQMFRESRGDSGSAVLPMYLKNPDGSFFEGSLGKDLMGAYGQSDVPFTQFKAAAAPSLEAQHGADRLVGDLFSGGVTRRMEENAAPVQRARVSASMDALHKTLASIDAMQANRGYTGDSLSNRMLRMGAQRTVGDARIANLQENADIRNYGDTTLPLQNINLPMSNAQNSGRTLFMPQENWLAGIQQRMAPFSMIRVGGAQPFQYQPLPVAGPTPSALQMGLSGIGQLGGSAMNYFMQNQQNQDLMSRFNAGQLNNIGYQAPSNWGSIPASAQSSYAHEAAFNQANMQPILAANGGVNPYE